MKAGVEELGKITYQAHNWSILKRMNLHHSWLPTFPDVYHSLPSKIGLMRPVYNSSFSYKHWLGNQKPSKSHWAFWSETKTVAFFLGVITVSSWGLMDAIGRLGSSLYLDLIQCVDPQEKGTEGLVENVHMSLSTFEQWGLSTEYFVWKVKVILSQRCRLLIRIAQLPGGKHQWESLMGLWQ